MGYPTDRKYTKEHEWVKLINDTTAEIGITEHAAGELGDIVYIDVETIDEELDKDAEFGSIEAVKTVAELFMPVAGTVLEVNSKLEDEPELINADAHSAWIVKIRFNHKSEYEDLMDAEDYEAEIS